LGVTVEASFSVGEYDIVILSAKESNGLETWLRQNDYRMPQGANQLLQPYIRQNMKFFVAKVNLGEFEKAGSQFLRPLQIAYESPKFMLPIRLGMINATSEQDLIVYVLSPKGQAEITNYRTVNVPSDSQIPVFVKNEFGDFYKAMFEQHTVVKTKRLPFGSMPGTWVAVTLVRLTLWLQKNFVRQEFFGSLHLHRLMCLSPVYTSVIPAISFQKI
jgi:hypothetical protein